jgi:hypothetical protein
MSASAPTLHLAELLTLGLQRERAEEQALYASYGPKHGHSPSSARACNAHGEVTGKCLRQQAYEWRRVPETNPTPEFSRLKMWCGSRLHEAMGATIIREVRALGGMAWTEIAVKRAQDSLAYQVSGRLDVELLMGAERFAADIKTSYGKGGRVEGPSPWDLLQFGLYLWLRPHNQYLSLCRVNALTGHLEAYRIDLSADGDTIRCNLSDTPWKLSQVFTSWWALEQHLRDGTLPDRDYERPKVGTTTTGHWRCRYCSWLDRCRQDDNNPPAEGREEAKP